MLLIAQIMITLRNESKKKNRQFLRDIIVNAAELPRKLCWEQWSYSC